MRVAQDVLPLQVKIVSLDVFGGVGDDAGLLFAGRLEGKSSGDGRVDLVFEGKHIARGAGKFLAP